MEMMKNLRCRLVPLALLPALMMAGCGQDAKELYQEARIMESAKAENGYSEQEILQKYEEAAQAGSEDAMLHLAGVYCESGDQSRCLQYLPKVRQKQAALADYYDGVIEMSRGQDEKAADLLTKAFKGGEARAAYKLAEYYHRRHSVHEAAKYYKAAFKSGDNRAAIPLARICLNSKNPAANTQGVEILQKLLRAEPDNREALLLSARAYILGLGAPVSLEKAGEIIKKIRGGDDSPDVIIAKSLYQIASKGAEQNNGIAALKSLIQTKMNPEAAYILYDIYYHGLYGIEKNLKEAIYYVRIAADGGLPKGMLALAEMYRQGQGVNANYDESFRLTNKALAAEPDLVDAMLLLGQFHAEGIGTRVDPREAYRYYREAAANGSRQAEYEGALLVLKGFIPDANYAETITILRKLADGGMPEAAYQFGHIQFLGNGVPRDFILAEEYLKKAVDKGVKEAFMPYATVLDFKGDFDNAALWYKVLADESIGTEVSAEAAARLGELYETMGKIKEAKRYYQQAYDAGIRSAGVNLGRLYYIEEDFPKAVSIFKREALESSVAATFMGLMYDLGKGGIAINEVKALEWYDKAVKNGNVDAMYLEGRLLHTAKTLPEHMTADARNLLESAACNGNVQAGLYLGTVYYPLDSEHYDMGAAWLRYTAEKLESKKAQDVLNKYQFNGSGSYSQVLERCGLKH